jgi:hypothetical protein
MAKECSVNFPVAGLITRLQELTGYRALWKDTRTLSFASSKIHGIMVPSVAYNAFQILCELVHWFKGWKGQHKDTAFIKWPKITKDAIIQTSGMSFVVSLEWWVSYTWSICIICCAWSLARGSKSLGTKKKQYKIIILYLFRMYINDIIRYVKVIFTYLRYKQLIGYLFYNFIW